MTKYINFDNQYVNFAIGALFLISLFVGIIQGGRYRRDYQMAFWPGAAAIGFLWDYLFIGSIIIKNFPAFPYQPLFIPLAIIWALGTVIILWLYNIKMLKSLPKALALFLKQLFTSYFAAFTVILLPLMIIGAVSTHVRDYRDNRGKPAYRDKSSNPWHRE